MNRAGRNQSSSGRATGRLANKPAAMRDLKTGWVEAGRCWTEVQALPEGEPEHRTEAAMIEPLARLKLAIRTLQQAYRKLGGE